MQGMRDGDLDELFTQLAKSKFRSGIKLREAELRYLKDKGLGVIEKHAYDFVAKRLAPAYPENDGKQTLMRNHPVFVAQHATATCCRKCLKKWHHNRSRQRADHRANRLCCLSDGELDTTRTVILVE